MNVEIDPVSELAVAEKITSRNIRIVGWYHSHPLFQPDPSVRDIQMQRNYQALFRDTTYGAEPFIGAIAATYDTRLPTEDTVYNWFWIRNKDFEPAPPLRHSKRRKKGTDSMSVPMQLQYRVVQEASIPASVVNAMVRLIPPPTLHCELFLPHLRPLLRRRLWTHAKRTCIAQTSVIFGAIRIAG